MAEQITLTPTEIGQIANGTSTEYSLILCISKGVYPVIYSTLVVARKTDCKWFKADIGNWCENLPGIIGNTPLSTFDEVIIT